MTLLAHHLHQTRQQHPTDSPDTSYFSSPSPPPSFDFDLYEDTQESAATAFEVQHPFDFSTFAQGLESSRTDNNTAWTDQSFMQDYSRSRSQQQFTPVADLPPLSSGSNHVQWNQNNAYLSPQTPSFQNLPPQSFRGAHKRVSSGSSATSTGPNSPYTQQASYPHIVDTDTHATSSPHLEAFDTYPHSQPHFDKATFSQHPGPVPFANQSFPQYALPSHEQYPMTARSAAMGRSRMNTAQGNGRAQLPPNANGEMAAPIALASNIPKLDRTVSDVYQDELFDNSLSAPHAGSQGQVQPSSNHHHHQQHQHLAPHRSSVFTDRLHQANAARSSSSNADAMTNMSRERSPFRDHSNPGQNLSQLPNSAGNFRNHSAPNHQIREQQSLQDDTRAYAQQHPQSAPQGYAAAQTTISPKETALDLDESSVPDDAKFPSLPQSSAHAAPGSFVTTGNTASNGITEKNRGDLTPRNGHSMVQPSSRNQTPTFSSSQQSSSSGGWSQQVTVMAPSNQYPFMRRQSSSMRSGQSDQVPEFPATLTSMESTKSESSREPNIRPPVFASQETVSSQRSDPASPPTRPADTSSHNNTYTCTAERCSARFDSSNKLLRHRREQHPESANRSTASPSAFNRQAAANNASRNNAPGPHRCERVNPNTGKPCNTVFSRSYDLTRHEDTLHNNRKQKVRCHLCTEEKTFSRNDALTRHMRVVHPEVDFPGRHRKSK